MKNISIRDESFRPVYVEFVLRYRALVKQHNGLPPVTTALCELIQKKDSGSKIMRAQCAEQILGIFDDHKDNIQEIEKTMARWFELNE